MDNLSKNQSFFLTIACLSVIMIILAMIFFSKVKEEKNASESFSDAAEVVDEKMYPSSPVYFKPSHGVKLNKGSIVCRDLGKAKIIFSLPRIAKMKISPDCVVTDRDYSVIMYAHEPNNPAIVIVSTPEFTSFSSYSGISGIEK